MAIKMRDMVIGIVLASFIFLAMFSFVNEWSNELRVTANIDVINMQRGLNGSLETMYEEAKTNQQVIEDSNTYSGTGDLGVISTEPFRVLKETLGLTKKIVINTTSEIEKTGYVPDWLRTLAITMFMVTMTFLAIKYVFKTE